MNTIMLVTSVKALEESLLLELRSRTDADQFGLRVAYSGEEAAHVLATTPVDLVLADLTVSDAEAPGWLSLLREARPDAPFLVLAEKDAAPNLAGLKGIWLARKPAEPKKILDAAISITGKEAKAYAAGAHIGYFLQIITSDQKTCSLTVRSRGRIGTLFFLQGQLIDAFFGSLRGREAALAVLCWQEKANIEVRKLYSARRRSIREPVDALIMESCRLKDSGAEQVPAKRQQFQVSGELLSLILSVEGLREMAVILRDGTLLAQKQSGDHLGALLAYMSMEFERVRTLMDWTGPTHIVINNKSGEKLIILFGQQIVVGLQTFATVSTTQVINMLSHSVQSARVA